MKKSLMGMAILDLCLAIACVTVWHGRAAEGAGIYAGAGRVGMISGAGAGKTWMGAGEFWDSAAGGRVRAQACEAREAPRIALTFDDGPHPVYTEVLLDGLKERGVKATFFVTGEHAGLHPDVIKRMQEEGHLIGNHTYSHLQLRSDNREEFKRELQKTNEVIFGITGEEVLYVRPPYGSWDRTLEKELNMFPVLWSIDPTDWNCMNAGTVTKRVLKKAGENSIILLHDYYKTSIEAALEIVDRLQEEGYEFVTVDEILMD